MTFIEEGAGGHCSFLVRFDYASLISTSLLDFLPFFFFRDVCEDSTRSRAFVYGPRLDEQAALQLLLPLIR